MKIPLLCSSNSDSNKLEIVTNGKVQYVNFPFVPYLLVYGDDLIDEPDSVTRMINLESNTEIDVSIIRTDDLSELKEIRDRHHKIPGIQVSYLSYMECLFVDRPDFFLQFPNTEALTYLSFDIEVMSDGSGIFPRSDTSPIIAIAAQINDQEPVIFDQYTRKDTDREILRKFIEFVSTSDPDIVVSYNGISFDLPYVFERCAIHKIDPSPLCRIQRNPVSQRWNSISRDRETIYKLHGRIHFDVLTAVRKDQTLHGIKSLGLKSVATHFGIPIQELDEIGNTKKYLGTEELKTYVASDTSATYKLSQIYIRNLISVAEFMQVPLETIVSSYNSFVPKIFHARHLREKNIIAFRSNRAKYGNRCERYEAAIVRFFEDKKGFHKKIHKIDWAGMYPSSMMTFNLSPETTRITAFEDLQEAPEFIRNDDSIILRIPDRNMEATVVIEIDTSVKGFIPEELHNLKIARDAIKKELRECKDEERRITLQSQQYALKVVMNIVYGYNGLSTAVYGDLAVAIATVGLCRWITDAVIEMIRDKVVEVDTDGYCLDSWEEGLDKQVNDAIDELIRTTFNLKSYMTLDHDEFGSGYFYKAKNYIVQDLKGRNIIHGTAFKSSNHTRLYDKVLDRIITMLLSGGNITDHLHELKDFSDKELSDFSKRVRINKPLKSYASENALPARLGQQAIDHMKYHLRPGDQVEYFVVQKPDADQLTLTELKKREYKLSSLVKSTNELDIDFYEEEIDKLLEKFDVVDPETEKKKAKIREQSKRIAAERRKKKKEERQMKLDL